MGCQPLLPPHRVWTLPTPPQEDSTPQSESSPPHDFNRDSKPDPFWQDQTTGAVNVWYMDRPTMLDAKYIYQAEGIRGRQVTCVRGR